jgi:hypothetical protein
MAIILRPYGVAATIDGVPLIAAGAVNYKVNPTLAAGDAKISADGGALANLTTLPAVTPAGGTAVRLAFSALELTCAHAVITIIDQTDPPEWEDQEIIIETYGQASAQHPYLGRADVTLADGHLTAAKFGASAITSTVLADAAITAAKIAANAIGNNQLASSAIGQSTIQNGSFTSLKFADNFLTAAKVAADAVVEIRDAIVAALNDIAAQDVVAALLAAISEDYREVGSVGEAIGNAGAVAAHKSAYGIEDGTIQIYNRAGDAVLFTLVATEISPGVVGWVPQ